MICLPRTVASDQIGASAASMSGNFEVDATPEPKIGLLIACWPSQTSVACSPSRSFQREAGREHEGRPAECRTDAACRRNRRYGPDAVPPDCRCRGCPDLRSA